VWLSIPFSRRVVTEEGVVEVAPPHKFVFNCWWLQVVHPVKGPVEMDLCRSTTLVMSDHGIEVFFEGATICPNDTMVGGLAGTMFVVKHKDYLPVRVDMYTRVQLSIFHTLSNTVTRIRL
jgi:hypothetical protein